jgi:leucyl-tRNA synthetase
VVGRVEKMSKSKRNTVDPQMIIDTYGADAARLFILSDSPPERDMEWTEAGIEGAWRYLQRLWRLVTEHAVPLPPPGTPAPAALSDAATALRRSVHKALHGVSEDLERFHFNKAVARIRELSNEVAAYAGADAGEAWALREAFEALTLMIGPIAPHLGEALWRHLGHETLLSEAAWPKADPALVAEDTVTIAVQVNGKLRATLTLPRDSAAAVVERAALAEDGVQRSLDGRAPKKVIVVPNRIVNIVG